MTLRSQALARRAARLVGLTGVAALVAVGLPTGSATAASMGRALDCFDVTGFAQLAGQGQAPPAGSLARDPHHFTAAEVAAYEAAFQRAKLETETTGQELRRRINIPVYFHIIREDQTEEGGNAPRSMVRAQIRVMNDAFAGVQAAAPSPRTPFRFTLKNISRDTNAIWFNAALPLTPVERQMKEATRRGGAETLNIWTVNLAQASLLGYATFPSDYESDPELDGVVMETQTMPGGTQTPYHLGDTATHEIGHWLGLFHTFQGGCANPGDRVGDTPYEAEPFYGPCSDGPRDSCAQPGDDPIENFMDYSDDSCLDRFTVGQRVRAVEMYDAFRAP